jgi:glycerol-3-phosphate acyltransferase PlsY
MIQTDNRLRMCKASMEIFKIAIILVIAYLMGSIPTGYILIKKLKGIDIRTVGSGNIGSTNVKRIGGGKIAFATQVGDIAKSLIPVLITVIICNMDLLHLTIDKNVIASMVALTCIIGHNFPVYLKFKGGKGVNTTMGAFAVLATIPVFAAFVTYVGLKTKVSIVSIKSLAAGFALALTATIINYAMPIKIAAWIAFLFMVIRHKDNIKRMIKGEEKGLSK